jgi:hypothetical protein
MSVGARCGGEARIGERTRAAGRGKQRRGGVIRGQSLWRWCNSVASVQQFARRTRGNDRARRAGRGEELRKGSGVGLCRGADAKAVAGVSDAAGSDRR